MTDINAQLAIDILLAHSDTLGATTDARTAFIDEVRARLVPPRTDEDRREGGKAVHRNCEDASDDSHRSSRCQLCVDAVRTLERRGSVGVFDHGAVLHCRSSAGRQHVQRVCVH